MIFALLLLLSLTPIESSASTHISHFGGVILVHERKRHFQQIYRRNILVNRVTKYNIVCEDYQATRPLILLFQCSVANEPYVVLLRPRHIGPTSLDASMLLQHVSRFCLMLICFAVILSPALVLVNDIGANNLDSQKGKYWAESYGVRLSLSRSNDVRDWLCIPHEIRTAHVLRASPLCLSGISRTQALSCQ